MYSISFIADPLEFSTIFSTSSCPPFFILLELMLFLRHFLVAIALINQFIQVITIFEHFKLHCLFILIFHSVYLIETIPQYLQPHAEQCWVLPHIICSLFSGIPIHLVPDTPSSSFHLLLSSTFTTVIISLVFYLPIFADFFIQFQIMFFIIFAGFPILTPGFLLSTIAYYFSFTANPLSDRWFAHFTILGLLLKCVCSHQYFTSQQHFHFYFILNYQQSPFLFFICYLIFIFGFHLLLLEVQLLLQQLANFIFVCYQFNLVSHFTKLIFFRFHPCGDALEFTVLRL